MSVALAREGQGNISNTKGVGQGVLVPDRLVASVYFGRDGEVLVILLTGGTKKP